MLKLKGSFDQYIAKLVIQFHIYVWLKLENTEDM